MKDLYALLNRRKLTPILLFSFFIFLLTISNCFSYNYICSNSTEIGNYYQFNGSMLTQNLGSTATRAIETYLPTGNDWINATIYYNQTVRFWVCDNSTGVCTATFSSGNWINITNIYGYVVNIGKTFNHATWSGAFGSSSIDCDNAGANSIIGTFHCEVGSSGTQCTYFNFNNSCANGGGGIVGLCNDRYIFTLANYSLLSSGSPISLGLRIFDGAPNYRYPHSNFQAVGFNRYDFLKTNISYMYFIGQNISTDYIAYISKNNYCLKYDILDKFNNTLLGSDIIYNSNSLIGEFYKDNDLYFNATGEHITNLKFMLLDSNNTNYSSYCLPYNDTALTKTYCPIYDASYYQTNVDNVTLNNKDYLIITNTTMNFSGSLNDVYGYSYMQYNLPYSLLEYITEANLTGYVINISNGYFNESRNYYNAMICSYNYSALRFNYLAFLPDYEFKSICSEINLTVNNGNFNINITDFFNTLKATPEFILNKDFAGLSLRTRPRYILTGDGIVRLASMENNYFEPVCLTITFNNSIIDYIINNENYYISFILKDANTMNLLNNVKVCYSLSNSSNVICDYTNVYGLVNFNLQNGEYAFNFNANNYYNFSKIIFINESRDYEFYMNRKINSTECNGSCLSGQILEKLNTDTRRIEGAEICITQNNDTICDISNEYGYYEFLGLNSGNIFIKVGVEGFMSRELNTTLRSGQNVKNFEMSRGISPNDIEIDECLLTIYTLDIQNKSAIQNADVYVNYETHKSNNIGATQFVLLQNESAIIKIIANGYNEYNDMIFLPSKNSYVYNAYLTKSEITGNQGDISFISAKELFLPLLNWLKFNTGGGIIFGLVITAIVIYLMNNQEQKIEPKVQIGFLVILTLGLIYMNIYPNYYGILIIIILAIYFAGKYVPQISGAIVKEKEE